MELTQLYYFKTVAKTEHFTRASDELHITQPTLSKTISRLEDDLGVQLFERIGSHVRLNEYGKVFLQQVNEMFVLLEDGKHQIANLKDAESGEIRIAATLQEILSPFIKDFILTHPKVHMHQVQATVGEMAKMLEDRTIDFAVSIKPVPSLNVEWIPLMVEEQGLIMSTDNPLSKLNCVRLADVSDERFLVQNSNQDLQMMFLDYCHQAGFEPNIYLEGDQPELIGELIAKNHGICFGSRTRFLYQESRRIPEHSGKVAYVSVTDIDCSRTIGIARLRGRMLSKSSQMFYEYLLNNLHPRDPETVP